MFKTLFISISIILVGCVNTDTARFYHPEYGVVDGSHDKLMVDSQICVSEFFSETGDVTESTLVGVDLLAKNVDEDATGNMAIAAILLRKGYQLAKNQSSCMTQKSWLRLESSK